jgi:hypothetical protein
MKYKKSISLLSFIIATLSLVAAAYGVLSNRGSGFEFKSLHGQIVSIYGKGLYQNDSISIAAQAIGQDIVTIMLAIPLLLISLHFTRKGLLKGKLLLTGTLGYFLYTYASYSFYSMYNSFFLIDVALMSMSFFAFTLSMMSFNIEKLGLCFSEKLPVKVIGGLLIAIASALGLLWIKMILTPLMSGTAPLALEHYTTLTIQAMDLGFVVPAAILSGVLLIRRKPFGYLLATVMTIKETTMLAAITVMMIVQVMMGLQVEAVVITIFMLFDLVIIVCLSLIMKNIKEPESYHLQN